VQREALPTLTLDVVPALTNEGALVAIGLGERSEDQGEALVGEVERVVDMRRLNWGFGWNKGVRLVIEEAKLDFHEKREAKRGIAVWVG
jgi:hypothetical protein